MTFEEIIVSIGTKPYYQDDAVVIYHADCRDILPKIPDKSIALVLTDPPYGINHSTGWNKGDADWLGTEISNDSNTSLRDWVLNCYSNVPAVVFGSHKRQPPLGTKMILIWDKGEALGMGDLSLPWKPSWEEIYIIGSGFHGKRTSAVLYNPPVQSMFKTGRRHPNEKPVALLKTLLRKCPDGITLDPFMGVGSVLLACKQLNRKCIGIEIEEKYCEIAAKRCSQSVMDVDGAIKIKNKEEVNQISMLN